MQENYQIRMRLATPLRSTIIETKTKGIFNLQKLQGGDPPQRLPSEFEEWNAAWDMTDEFKSKTDEPESDDNDDDGGLAQQPKQTYV